MGWDEFRSGMRRFFGKADEQETSSTALQKEQLDIRLKKAISRPSSAPAEKNCVPSAEILAAAAAQGKRFHDDLTARVRSHVEREALPLSPDDTKMLAQAATMRLAIRHQFPPAYSQRSMSFLGGEPYTPAKFDYPMILNREGVLEALTFIGQIDCASIPEGDPRRLIPRDGYLYFFAPMSENFGPDAHRFVCRYVSGRAKGNWEPNAPLALLALAQGQARWRWPWSQHVPSAYDRIEIEFCWITEYEEVEPDDPDAADGLPWEIVQRRRYAKLNDFYGASSTDRPSPLSPSGKPTDALWLPFDGFPGNQRAAEILLRFLHSRFQEERGEIARRLAALPESDSSDQSANTERERLNAAERAYLHYKIGDSLVTLDRLLQKEDYHRPLTAAQHEALLSLLERIRIGDLPPAIIERRYASENLPNILNEWIGRAAAESAEAAMANPETANTLPANVLDELRRRHATARHQMFGKPEVVQVAGEEMEQTHILLLQVKSDDPIGVRIGDSGLLQYWIHPQDLIAKRFENTILTIESH